MSTGKTWTVTVFGGSRASPGDQDYHDAYRLGQLLARHGFVVCNGGYNGTMEAACRGAKEAGGRTIGVTLELFAPLAANPWVDEEHLMPGLFQRLERLTGLGDAYVVLRGGIGTLLELAMVWNLAQVKGATPKPIIVVGHAWHRALDGLRQGLPVREIDWGLLTPVDSVDEAVAHLVRLRGL